MTFWFCGNSVFAQGHGWPNYPYRIRKANELVAFANCLSTGNEFYYYKYGYSKDWICSPTPPTYGEYDTIPAYGEGKYFLIPNDIILNQGNLAACDGVIDPAWTVWPETVVFKGHLLGDKHTISGMYIDRPDSTVGVGFFSKMEGDAHIEKLGIVNSYVRGGASNIGGMVGELSGGHINDCFFEGSIRTSGDNVGGLVGLMTLHDTLLPEVSVCFASGHVDCSGDYVAGLVGKVEKGTVRQSYSSMIVRTTDMVGIALSGANPTKGGIGTEEDIVNQHIGGIYGYALSPFGTNSYDPDVDSIRVDTCYFDWQLSDLPSIPGSSWVPADWRANRGAAALSTYDMTYYSMMYFDIKNQKPSLWKNTYLCNVYPYPDPFNDPINVTYRLELDYPQDSIVTAALVPFLDVFMKPNGNGQSTINNMNDQERQYMKLSNLTESFVLWKGCDSLDITWTLDSLWPDAVRREFYAPDNSWNVYLQKQGVVRLTVEVAGRTRYYDAVVNIPPYVGSAENPFLISNLEDFLAFRDGINANEDFVYHRFLIPRDSLPHIHWIQTADIDLASAGDWIPIGKNADTCFTGFYDGRGHKLMNLTMTNGIDRALFVYSKGEIRNLVLEDPHITGCRGSSAALATNVKGGSFENCAVTYSAESNNHSPLQFVGSQCAALIGSVEMGNEPHTSIHITGCFNSCDIVNYLNGGYAAGLVGYVNADTCILERCFNTGDISVVSGVVHPLVGHSRSTTRRIYTDCYNAGVLTGNQVEVESTNTTFYNDYHVNPVCEGATKVATRYFIGPEALVREYMGDDDWLYEEGRYPRLGWTDSSSVRMDAIAACTPRLALDSLPLPDTVTVDNFHDLNNLRNIVNGNYMVIYKDYLLPHYVQDIVFSLTNDINLYDITSNWISIGTKRFAGTFLGNNHTLGRLSSTRPVAGLFGTLTGKVYDLNITVETIVSSDTAGAVCAILNGGRIENCSVKKYNNTSDNLYGVTVGGIAGVSLTANDSIIGCFNYVDVMGIQCIGGIIAKDGNVKNSANLGDITGNADCPYIGGISGRNTNVISSLNTGIITAQPGNALVDNYVGGLVGRIENEGLKIENCYNAGIVNGENRKYVGGICGAIDGSITNNQSPIIQNCYVSNTVRSTGTHLGSIAGSIINYQLSILNCCYDKQMSPVGGIDGSDQTGVAKGLPTDTMMGEQYMKPLLGGNSSDSIWYYQDDYYPQLKDVQSINAILSKASAMRAKLYTTETYSTVSHQFTLNYADGGNWQRIGGSNCVSLGSPNNNLITATIPSTNNHPAQGYITLGFRGPSTNDPVYRKVQLWVNLSEANPIIIKDSLQLTRFRTIINQGSGYYNSSTQTFLTTGSPTGSQYVRITDGGRDLYFKLTANVDLAFHGTTYSGQQYNVLNLWTSIGTKTHPFRGHFDGGNRTVKNFIVPGNNYQGFFGYIYGGTVKNLTIAGAITNHQTTGDHRGILCGYNNSGTIRNCFITQDVGSNYHSPSRLSAVTGCNLGFICGTNYYGRIVRCRTDMTQIENATYTHGSCFGGICGYNDFGTIDSCRSHLAINPGVTIDTVGGIVGYNHNGILVADTSYNNSYNKSIMSYVGCIAGYSDGQQSEIRSCYVDEQSRIPSHGNYIGGVVGKMDNGIIDGCEHLGTIIPEGNYIGGIAGLCAEGARINGCFNAGTVCETKSDDYVGGIVGSLTDSSSVSACFNSGLVTGRYFVGGLIGHLSEACHFTDCYNTGVVKGISLVGGIVGLQQDPTVSSGYGYSAGWVEGSSMVGAVCGYTSDMTKFHDLHYDKQMCSYKGVNEEDVTGVTAHSTSEMMGVTFGGDRPWMYGEGMYPRLSNISDTDASKVSALALQIGDVYNLSFNPNTSYTLPSYTPVTGTNFKWNKVKSSDKAATLSGTTLTASGTRDFMRIKATKTIFSNGENHTIPLRTVQLSFGISEEQPLTLTILGFRQLRSYINNGQTFYYSGGSFFSTNQQLTNATPIPADADGIYFKLTNDDDYTTQVWTPIGTEEHPFRGYLDGGDHSIHVVFDQSAQDLRGLFGYMQGRVSNLYLKDLSVTGHDRVGALAGYCNGTIRHCGTLSSCSSTPVVKGQTAVGGLIGEAFFSQIFDCYNGSNVRGKQSVGGIVGLIDNEELINDNYLGFIKQSFNYGMVSGSDNDSRVGGMIGSIQNSEFKIQNCYNTGAVNGKTKVAGIAGAIHNSQFTILNCYNAGYVTANSQVSPFGNSILNSEFLILNSYYDRQLCPLDANDTTAHLTTEMIGDSLKPYLGEDSWIYNDHEYPHLKVYDSTMAARVSVKPIYLTGRMLVKSIVADFKADTTAGVKWYRYGTGTALNEPDPENANGNFTLNTCGEDSLMVVLTDGNVCARRVVPLNVAAANIKVDTILACSAYTWKPTNDHTEILDKPGFYSYSPEGEDCDSTKAIELFFSSPLETTINKQDACMDSYWSKYGHNIGFLKATVLGGGFSTEHTSTEYTYKWSRANGTIDNESFIAGHPDSLRYLSSDTYYLTTTDINAPLCQTHDTILVDEYSFNYLATKWGNCVDTDDGWIELVIRQFEFNRDGSPYSIMCWDSSHVLIADDTIPALNPPDESGVPKGYDTLFNLANGLYYITITDRLGCYQDKQIKVNDPINPKMTLRANGFKKVYDGTPVSLNDINRINVVEYDDNWKVPERAEYYITSDKWRQLALRIGDSLIVSLSDPNMMIKDVDSVRNKIVGWSIKDAETGKDKTCLYHFYPIDSCIVIVPATLTLFTGSATKEYDGTELTSYNWNVQGLQNGEHVWCTPSTSLTDVDTIENSCYIDWNNPGPWSENIAQEKNYTVIYHFGTLSVTPNTQPVTITAGSSTKVFDGTPLTNDTISYSGLPNGFYVEATTSGSQTDVGTSQNVVNSYMIKNANGEDKTAYFTNVTTVAGTLTVNPTQLTVITGSAIKEYDGTPLTSNSVCIRYGIDNIYPNSSGQFSIFNSQFSIQTTGSQTIVGQSNNGYIIDWGTTNSNNYEISDTLGLLTVNPATAIVTANDNIKIYGNPDPALTATVTGAVFGDFIAYSLSREPGDTVGTYPITVTLGNNPNYNVIANEGTFTINKKAATVVADNKSKTYGDTDPELTATVSGTVGSDVIAYSLSREAGETTGTYPITVTLGSNPNYDVTPTNGIFTIARATATVKADDKEKVAGSADPTLTATVSGLRNNDAASVINYTLIREDGQVVGTYAITPTGDDVQGNYNVTYLPGTFTITPQNEVVVRIVGHNNTSIYDNTEHSVSGYDVASISNPVYTDTDFVFNGTAEAHRTNADTSFMGLTAGQFVNKKGSFNVTFIVTDGYQAISPAPATIVADNKNKTYGDTDPELTAIVTGSVGNDVIAYSLSRSAGEAAGTYPITVTPGSNPNYQVTATNGTFTITRAALTVKADNKDKTFGATDPELTATIIGLQNNDAANVVSYTLSREAGENVGTYTITPAGSAIQGNYNVTYETGTFTIISADAVVVTITGQRDTTVYNGVEHSVRGYDVSINNPLYTENDFTFSGIDTAIRTDVGISLMGLNSNQFSNTSTNFNQVNFIVKDGWQMVTKAPATIKADTLSKIYGNANPELTATVSGIAQGDSIAFTLSREPGETVGTYAINVTLDDNDSQNKNYQLSAINAQLSITPRAATVVADNLGKTYGESDSTLTATVTGTVGNDTIAYSLSRTPGDTVGTYPITVTLGSNPNYEVTATNGTFTINKKAATVAADSLGKTYGETDPTLTATVTGSIGNDTIAYSLSRAAGENAGTYTITVTLGNNPNYEVTATNGIFFIDKRIAQVTANNSSKIYGEADPEFTATVTDTLAGDTLNYTLVRSDGENVGSYTIMVNLGTNPNYEVIRSNGVFTIEKKAVSVTASDKSKIYGSADPELTATVTGSLGNDVINYTLSRAAGENVGTYPITVTPGSNPNYEVTTISGTFTINKKAAMVVATNKNKTYGNADPTLTATVTGTIGNDALNYTLAREAGENVGLYPITATLSDNPNYEVSTTSGTFTIYPATAMVMADNKEKVHSAPDPQWTATVTGLKNGDSESVISYTITREPGDTVGTYAITPSGATKQGNYNVTYIPGTLTIVNDTLIITGTLANLTVYGCSGADATPYTTVAQLEAAGLTIQGDCPAGNVFHVSYNDLNIGSDCPTVTRTYTISDDCNHSVTTSQTIYFTHNEAPHEINGPVPTSSDIHCAVSENIPPHTNSNILMPLVVDTCGNVLDFGTPTFSNNYNTTTCSGDFIYHYTYTDCAGKVFQWNYTYHVLPPSLSFTAPGNIAVCRNTDGSYTITPDVTGTISNVSVTCSSVDTSYSDASPVQNPDGTLTIVRTWTVSDTCQNTVQKQQVITVNPLPSLTVTPASQEITYGDNITPVVIDNSYSTISLSALPSGLTYNPGTQTITGSPAAIGSYTITATATSNQTPACGTTTQDISINVNPKPLTITALNQTFIFNGNPQGENNITYTNATDIASKVSVSGLMGNDQLTSITLNGLETHIGVYPNTIEPSSAIVGSATANYNITYVPGTLTISSTDEVEVKIIGHHNSTVYDGNIHTVNGYDVMINNPLYTENDFSFSGTAEATKTDAGTSYMGLADSMFTNTNYDFVQVTFRVTDGYQEITPRSVTLTSATDQKVYDGTSLTNSNVTVSGEGFVEGEGASYVVTGNQMLVGSSDNSFTYTLNSNTTASNYNINTIEGVLTVTDGTNPNDPNPVNGLLVVTKEAVSVPENGEKFQRGEVVTFSITATNIYDEPKTITLSEIPGVTLAQSSFMNVSAGEAITTTATYTITEADALLNHFTNTVMASVGNLTKIAEATVETMETDSIVITSADHEFYYDGTSHTYPSYTLSYNHVEVTHMANDSTRFVLPDGDTLSIIHPASIAYVSENMPQNNSFAYTLNQGNHPHALAITTVFGTISIIPNPAVITITAGSATKLYDGTPLVSTSYTYTPADVLAPGDSLVVQIEGSITQVGQADNVVVDYRVYRNENYNATVQRGRRLMTAQPAGYTLDVTNCYTFNNEMVNGTLTIIDANCPDAVDFEGNHYPAIRLGGSFKCWTSENLRSTLYSDGRPIDNVMDYYSETYPNTVENVNIFGHLYDWYAAVDTMRYGSVDSIARAYNLGHHIQGVCPQGWYMPTDNDFEDLDNIPTTDLRSTQYWIHISGIDNTNASGFNAQPGGMFNCANGRYENITGNSYFWSCHPVFDMATGAKIDYICERMFFIPSSCCDGFSIRCILDEH
jgi:uncharacterized protein (TIGR02145 family)